MSSEQDPKLTSRRDFVRQASCAAVGTWALTSTIRDLRLMNAALAQSAPLNGYKALVCLFLGGGNDSNNLIVPTDATTHAAYGAIRGNLTLPLGSLLTLRTGTSGASPAYVDQDGRTLGLHPAFGDLQTLFGEGKLAAIKNVGTLVRPITRAEYLANATGTRPPQLFSHSDQVTQWQTSIPDRPPATGWGGRVADILSSVANPSGNISMSVSVNGSNTFEVGNLVSQYHVSTAGAVTLSGALMQGTGARVTAMRSLLALDHTNLQRTAYADVVDRAIATGDLLNSAIQATQLTTDTPAGTWTWNVPFPNTGLGNQLKMIARLIEARTDFNMNRQIFFCSIGGYDTHTNQVTVNGTSQPTNVNGAHYRLLNDVDNAVFAFQRAMEQLGLGDKVTTFTASDFNRTLVTNSQGSDHGWGGHHFVIGGAVQSHTTVGSMPTFQLSGPSDTSSGRWIPTTAVDQYAATIARWFGVDEPNLTTIFPNLPRFATSNLGFMKPG